MLMNTVRAETEIHKDFAFVRDETCSADEEKHQFDTCILNRYTMFKKYIELKIIFLERFIDDPRISRRLFEHNLTNEDLTFIVYHDHPQWMEIVIEPLQLFAQSYHKAHCDILLWQKMEQYPAFIYEPIIMAQWLLQDTAIASQLDAIRTKIEKHRDNYLKELQNQALNS